MSNEISVLVRVSHSKNGVSSRLNNNGRMDMSGDHHQDIVQDLTTTEEAVDLGDVIVAGWVTFEPVETNTNDVIVGVKPSGTFIEVARVRANSPPQVIRVGANALWAKAASGTQRLRSYIIES